jgi:hypothetical protein
MNCSWLLYEAVLRHACSVPFDGPNRSVAERTSQGHGVARGLMSALATVAR